MMELTTLPYYPMNGNFGSADHLTEQIILKYQMNLWSYQFYKQVEWQCTSKAMS